ncbi:glycosyltransferase [Streptomyces sp. NBC_00683]|uniref:glycosyltransferase n=1 Tax=Streptomyces sp. NBC_00683 TaxID=2903670 RepID=UPI002E308D53|nr:glycosyltransferase [Streptomyces sp. NBC_00683]
MDISVVIPTRDKARHLERTLESLTLQELPNGTYEIIVVDNGSTDETPDVIDRYRRLDPRVRSVTVTQPNRALARNSGIAEATGEIVLFIDDDCICPRTLLHQHLAQHRKSTDNTVVLGARREVFSLLPVDDTLTEAIKNASTGLDPRLTSTPTYQNVSLWDIWDIRHRIDTIEAAAGMHDKAARAEHLDLIAEGGSVAPWLSFLTCHVSVPIELCRSVGSFDDQFLGWGEEDTELGYRLWQTGASFVALPGTPVYHQVHSRPDSDDNQSWFVNYVRATEKHPSTDWYLRWRVSLRYISHIDYEDILREVMAGDVRRKAHIKRQYDTFVRFWPSMKYGGTRGTAGESATPTRR